MAINNLLNELKERGVELTLIAPDKIRYRSPKPVPPELIEKLKCHKAELIASLKIRQTAGTTVELARKMKKWGCESCPHCLPDEGVCIVESSRAFHMVTIACLKDCPRRSEKIRNAILNEQHRQWLT